MTINMTINTSNGYRLTIQRDQDAPCPLDTADMPVSQFYREHRYATLTREQALIAALYEGTEAKLVDWISDEWYQMNVSISGINPLNVDWYCLEGCHPDEEPVADYASEAADNAALLEWAGISPTREAIYSDELPDELVAALLTYATSQYVIRQPAGGYDMHGDTYLYCEVDAFIKRNCEGVTFEEGRGICESWMDALAEEYEAWQDGDVWGYSLTRALFDDDGEYVEDVSEDVSEEGPHWGFYGGTHDCITSAGCLPEAVVDALKAHCGSWLEECTVDVYDQVEEAA